MMTTAKGLTSGYAPIGAVIVGERVAEPFWRAGSDEVFRHGYTYSGAPHRVRGRPGQPRPDRAGGPARPGGRARAGAGRASGPAGRAPAGGRRPRRAPACSPRSRSPRTPAPRTRASRARLVTAIRERGVITRLLRGRPADLAAVRDHRGGDRPDRGGVRRRAGRGGLTGRYLSGRYLGRPLAARLLPDWLLRDRLRPPAITPARCRGGPARRHHAAADQDGARKLSQARPLGQHGGGEAQGGHRLEQQQQ